MKKVVLTDKYYLNRKNFDERFDRFKHNAEMKYYHQVAGQIGLGKVQFSQIMSGSRPVKKEILKKLAELYNCEWPYLACTKSPDGTFHPLFDYPSLKEYNRQKEKLAGLGYDVSIAYGPGKRVNDFECNGVSAALIVREIAQAAGGLAYLVSCIKDAQPEDAVFSHLCDALIARIDEKEGRP